MMITLEEHLKARDMMFFFEDPQAQGVSSRITSLG
jgi:hypothetical protein